MSKRVFIYGYHGFRNIGAECRLVAIVHELNRRLAGAEILVNTFQRRNLSYLRGARAEYFHPATYSVAARRRIKESDLLLLSEGNMLTETFSKHMVLAFTTALEQAAKLAVPSVGLALDSGRLSPKRKVRVAEALNTTALLTVRAPGAGDELRAQGVRVPMPVTADCAVSMPLPTEDAQRTIRHRLGMLDGPVFGIAPVDFFMYPAHMALVGRPADYIRWPFKATWPDNGRERTQRLVADWVGYGKSLLSTTPRAKAAVVAMDPSDIGIARRVQAGIGRPDRTLLLTGRDLDPVQMSGALGGLSSIATSRYHALVLPLAYAVPYLAVGHDTRTRFISDELGVTDYFIPFDAPRLQDELRDRHWDLIENRDNVRHRLRAGFADFRRRDQENYRLLGDLLADRGFDVQHASTVSTAP